MKKSKMIMTAFAVVAIVGSALAFKPFGQGEVFCNQACTTESKINWKLDPLNQSQVTDPCDNGAAGEYRLNPSTQNCEPIAGRFITTPA